MYCTKCGNENPDDAVFCKKCGGALDEEEQTVVARSSSTETDDEEQIFSIHPTLMFVKIGYAGAVLGAFLLVILLNLLGNAAGFSVPYYVSIPLGFLILLIPAYFHLRQKIVRYTLTDSKVEIDHGLVSKTTRNVPLRIIQDVTVSASVFQRMLGFGNLEIENANENDEKIVLKNINSPKKYAELLLKQMRRLNK
ncbi:MAG: PH domain-containing protein [Pyrinomonadaceae bacterium]|nr:PH domain-containing protein [Pyrinomonadaceae bacterium]